jgi:hypothetical protein
MGTTGISNLYLKGASVNLADTGGDVNIGTSASSGNIAIGNSTTTKYTAIDSQKVSINTFLSNGGYVEICGSATGTTSYTVLGSINLGGNYIRGKAIYMNTDGTGDTNIGNYR